MNILLTGGAGYIGSHTAVVLIEAGHSVFIVDNFCNSDPLTISYIEEIVKKKITYIKSDIRDSTTLIKFLKDSDIDAVIHFAGLKAVGESSQIPLEYYANNVQGTISLLQAMEQCDVTKLVFSSSATVYGDPLYLPIDENHPTNPKSPYGRTKLHIEELLRDIALTNSRLRIACLRYFNPVGAHESALIGESPKGIPNNLVPFISQVVNGMQNQLSIFGSDYATEDGTGVRDYIHIIDLAQGHLSALSYLDSRSGFEIFNLGTGNGHSVLKVLETYEQASEKKIPFQVVQKRYGDIESSYACIKKSKTMLSWHAKKNLLDMCQSSWNFYRNKNL